VCVFFTGVKSFREARGSLFLLFFQFPTILTAPISETPPSCAGMILLANFTH
jgi:hypothetical protein